MSGDERTNGNPNALAFWEAYADTPGNRAWRAWRRNLEDVSESLALYRAESAASDARLLALKADADARVVEAEAETARLEAAVEIADAALERSLHQLRGGLMQ